MGKSQDAWNIFVLHIQRTWKLIGKVNSGISSETNSESEAYP